MTQTRPVITGTKLWLSLVLRMGSFALALLWPAGTWWWPEAWAVIAIWSAYAAVMFPFLLRHDPALLAERMKESPIQKGQKTWDKVLSVLMFVVGIPIYIVPGLDVMRFGWSEPLPVWVEVSAMVLHVPCLLFLAWVTRENPYLSRVVKIDTAGGHRVITTGPYALVRHPMYVAVIILVFAVPVALGSRYALIPAAMLVVILLVRTALEDRTLHAELPGYPAYAQKTRFRLIPGVW